MSIADTLTTEHEYVHPRAAVRRTGLSIATLARYSDRGYLPHTRVLPSGQRRYAIADLDAVLAVGPQR